MTAGLLALFNAFAQQEADRSGGGGAQRQVVDPTQLREALAAFNAASFSQGTPSPAPWALTAHCVAPSCFCGPQRSGACPSALRLRGPAPLTAGPSQLSWLDRVGGRQEPTTSSFARPVLEEQSLSLRRSYLVHQTPGSCVPCACGAPRGSHRAYAGRAGEMSDAVEVLGAIYDSLRTAPGGGALVDAVFGLHVAERVHCAACGRDTHASAYTQYFYNASATALRLQARRPCGRSPRPLISCAPHPFQSFPGSLAAVYRPPVLLPGCASPEAHAVPASTQQHVPALSRLRCTLWSPLPWVE